MRLIIIFLFCCASLLAQQKTFDKELASAQKVAQQFQHRLKLDKDRLVIGIKLVTFEELPDGWCGASYWEPRHEFMPYGLIYVLRSDQYKRTALLKQTPCNSDPKTDQRVTIEHEFMHYVVQFRPNKNAEEPISILTNLFIK
jgi:hypothetical protein